MLLDVVAGVVAEFGSEMDGVQGEEEERPEAGDVHDVLCEGAGVQNGGPKAVGGVDAVGKVGAEVGGGGNVVAAGANAAADAATEDEGDARL